ncbi:MAG: phage virion morphogenesis protein [Bacteroidales bacterium]
MPKFEQLSADFKQKAAQINKLKSKSVKYIAAAAEKMKDANFSAQGFVENGSAKKWPKRKKNTAKNSGKNILFDTGILKNSVKANPAGNLIRVGVDLGKVPYAKAHNEGGRLIQYVKPHTCTHYKTGKRYQVKGFSRKMTLPQRKFLGFSPDIFKIANKDIKHEIDKLFNS